MKLDEITTSVHVDTEKQKSQNWLCDKLHKNWIGEQNES